MKKVLFYALAVLLMLGIALWFGGRWVLSQSVADYEGDVVIEGIAAPVEVTFDARGIPQIWAATDADLYFTLGWLHASERLFHMELIRRTAAGTLAEVFGEIAYAHDVRQRRLGFARRGRRDADALDAGTRALLERYVAGVNAWRAQRRILPPEFVLTGLDPAPWTVEDVLGALVYQSWFSHGLMGREEDYEALIRHLGPDALRLLQAYLPWSPPTVPDGPLGPEPFPLRMTEASNSWVVAPSKSASGAALHASDPHLAVHQVPVLWYAAGLHSDEGTHAVGVTAPGVPFVSMGHTGTIAYAFTVASVDIIDYYRFPVDPADSLRVQTPDGYVPLTPVHEDIAVKGEAAPRRVTFYESPRGPVVAREAGAVVALWWAGYDHSAADMSRAGVALHHARDFDAFRRAVTGLGALDVNWTYSDRTGNIGYQLGSPVPVRDVPNPFVTYDGTDPAAAWRGYRPLDETPHAYNPPRGWLATANNQVVGPGAPYGLPGYYDPYRITRLEALLAAGDAFTQADLEAMQMDRHSARVLRWKDLLVDGADRLGRPDLARALRTWDAAMMVDDTLATIASFWWHRLARPLFEDELGDDWPLGRRFQTAVLTADSTFIDDTRTPARETAADISARALDAALADARGRPYGAVSTLTVAHPLAAVPLLDAWLRLNRGPVPFPGDGGTLNANFNAYDEETDRFESRSAPSMRFVLDWAAVDRFTLNVAFGQSGNPFSPHYDDFFAPSLAGERWVVPFSRDAVYARRASLLRLRPAGG